ncbi:MAG: haloacid dehalogenase-like hydrolase, partial [Lachnospiraceae bacterium]|nr:haloacid dehalogenase-like hydrolase [Lachnospiraceae bacterium]
MNENKDTRPVLAICYDFDKTLSPDNMQAQGYIQSLNFEKAEEFWKKSDVLAEENDMDQNLAYMYLMIEDAVGKFYVTPEKL